MIVGTNVGTRPYIDWTKDADYWVFNEVAGLSWPQKVDGVFQMHLPPLWRSKRNVNDRNHYDWLQKEHPYPIWMIDKFKDVPASVKYPLDEICEECLSNITDEKENKYQHFTSTAAYAVALAIYQKRPEIWIYGIECATDSEYFRQKAGLYFWLGKVPKETKIYIHSKSLLFHEPIYGYRGEMAIQRMQLELSKQQYEAEAAKFQAEMFERQGSTKSLLEAIFMARDPKQAEQMAHVFLDAYKESQDACFKYGQAIGAVHLCEGFIKDIQALIDAAGGERALQTIMSEGLKEEIGR